MFETVKPKLITFQVSVVHRLPLIEVLNEPGYAEGNQAEIKELTERHHKEWSLRLNLTQHGKTHPARTL